MKCYWNYLQHAADVVQRELRGYREVKSHELRSTGVPSSSGAAGNAMIPIIGL